MTHSDLSASNLESICKKFDKTFCIALQYEEHVSKDVLSIVEKLPRNYLFLVRMHPLVASNSGLVSNIFFDHGIQNIEWRHTNSTTTEKVLKLSDGIITDYSSAAIDGFLYNKPSFFLNKNAKKLFSNYSNNGLCHFIENIEDGIRKISDLETTEDVNGVMSIPQMDHELLFPSKPTSNRYFSNYSEKLKIVSVGFRAIKKRSRFK